MATNGSFAQQDQYKVADQYPTGATDAAGNAANNNLSKDEVGWYFVEQYYTTLSKSPEKLHLFYGKRSQFVYGREAQVANVSVGRQDIQERIRALEFQDCKVRVSNVDSQASFDNIVIQVIGETSNKGAEPKKFVQTFVLAQQPSGYFVLNDILRYINEEDAEEGTTAQAEATERIEATDAAPVVMGESTKAQAKDAKEHTHELDADTVDEKLKAASSGSDVAPITVNGGDADKDLSTTASAADTEAAAPAADAAVTEAATETIDEVEKPKEPSPTPVAKPETVAAEPTAPPKPMTWASRAAAAAGPRPVVPLPKTATPPAQNQSRAPAPAAPAAAPAAPAPTTAAAPTTSAPAAPPAAPAAETQTKDASGWQTAGADSKRQNRPQSISGNIAEKDGNLGYVKYVTEKVQDADLRSALAAHGELAYFDINRSKNCAFVEYKTAEGYQAAINANPHVVNGENIIVEPRRPKSAAYGGNNYGSGRGNASGGRGRGNFDGNRRGRGSATRGRGGAQATNA